MKRVKNFLPIFLLRMVVQTACAKKATTPQSEYKEPISFDIFKLYEDMPLDTSYVKKVHDTWQNELKDDEVIKNHTWRAGDYRVFVYLHGYIFFTDTSYYEALFFTTTPAQKCTKKVHSSITVFAAQFKNGILELSKIRT